MIRSLGPLALAATLFLAGCAATESGTPDTRPPAPSAMPAPSLAASIRVPSEGARVYVLGDSWAYGVSAAPGEGYLRLLQGHYGWDILIDGQPGTGYEAVLADVGEPFIDRLEDLPDDPPELLIIAGGLNDEWAGWMNITDNIEDTFEAAEQRYPGVDILAIGPVPTKLPLSEGLAAVDTAIAEVTTKLQIPYISPIERGWVTDENVTWFINGETRHPDSPGHAQLADWLVSELTERATG